MDTTMATLDRLSLLSLALQRGARREPAAGFVEWAFGALKQQLPFDTAMWATGYLEPGQAPVMQTAQLHRQPPQMLDYLQCYGIAHALATCTIDPQTRLITGISLWRADAARPYTEPAAAAGARRQPARDRALGAGRGRHRGAAAPCRR